MLGSALTHLQLSGDIAPDLKSAFGEAANESRCGEPLLIRVLQPKFVDAPMIAVAVPYVPNKVFWRCLVAFHKLLEAYQLVGLGELLSPPYSRLPTMLELGVFKLPQ